MSAPTTRTPTLTFYTVDDFIGEIERRQITRVHCQPAVIDSSDTKRPLQRYQIVLTCYDEGVVLACTIVVDQRWSTASSTPQEQNLATAQNIMTAYMAEHQVTVLPGMYHHERDGFATCNLWRFDRESKRLIAVAPADPPKTSVLYAGVQGEDIHLFLRITHTLDDAGKLPDVLRAAIAAWLKTPEGAAVNKPIDGDFNWGDYAEWHEEIPLPDGIASVEVVTDEILTVDHDDRLSGEDG